MNKEKFGIKRICLGCGTRFYDLNKSPIVCPTCGETFDPEYLQKRKSKINIDKESTEDIVDVDLIEDTEEDTLEDEDDVPLNDQDN